MSWRNLGICDDCWFGAQAPHDEKGPRLPVRLSEEYRETETCCDCGTSTRSGIYVRREVTDE
jgi:hypothetical protein